MTIEAKAEGPDSDKINRGENEDIVFAVLIQQDENEEPFGSKTTPKVRIPIPDSFVPGSAKIIVSLYNIKTKKIVGDTAEVNINIVNVKITNPGDGEKFYLNQNITFKAVVEDLTAQLSKKGYNYSWAKANPNGTIQSILPPELQDLSALPEFQGSRLTFSNNIEDTIPARLIAGIVGLGEHLIVCIILHLFGPNEHLMSKPVKINIVSSTQLPQQSKDDFFHDLFDAMSNEEWER